MDARRTKLKPEMTSEKALMLLASKLSQLDTPAIIIDEGVAKRNILSYQNHCDKVGLALRPHIKTHKTQLFAKAQMDAGACGITCQKIGEAEIMADAGLDDILITFNILGRDKLSRLQKLHNQISKLSVTADNQRVVGGLADAFSITEKSLNVLVECDTGAGRCGVQSPQEACDLAKTIAAKTGLSFGGLMTYPSPGGADGAAAFMKEAIGLLKAAGLKCCVVSTGGSPDMWSAKTHDVFTEYRIGTYIYNDRSLVKRKACSWDDCALGVLTTVVSTPEPGRAIIDAGSKSLTSDLLGLEGYGHVVGSQDTDIVSLSEEHGILHFGAKDTYSVGDRIIVIPNHVCVVSNLFDYVWLVDENQQTRQQKIDARGLVS